MLNKIREKLREQRGDVFQWIIVITVVSILAAATIPGINEKVSAKANTSIDKIDAIDPSSGTN